MTAREGSVPSSLAAAGAASGLLAGSILAWGSVGAGGLSCIAVGLLSATGKLSLSSWEALKMSLRRQALLLSG